MEFCNSMGDGVSLATIESREENYEVKTWLLKHGKNCCTCFYFVL